MSKQKMKITLHILDSDYSLACEPHERNILIEAAETLNSALVDMRRANPKLSLERLVVLGGLQMAFDLLQERQTMEREVSMVNQVSARLISALGQALEEQSHRPSNTTNNS